MVTDLVVRWHMSLNQIQKVVIVLREWVILVYLCLIVQSVSDAQRVCSPALLNVSSILFHSLFWMLMRSCFQFFCPLNVKRFLLFFLKVSSLFGPWIKQLSGWLQRYPMSFHASEFFFFTWITYWWLFIHRILLLNRFCWSHDYGDILPDIYFLNPCIELFHCVGDFQATQGMHWLWWMEGFKQSDIQTVASPGAERAASAEQSRHSPD